MKKTQINSEEEYRQHCFPICQEQQSLTFDEAYGLIFIRQCYTVDEEGNELDEEGNIIPPDTPENVGLADWVKELQYPIILVEWVEKIYNRKSGIYTIVCVEPVSIHEFK
jgi:hypothetical protein